MAEPIVIQVKRYVCPFCRRPHSKKPAAVGHIARCWANPATRACRSCRFHQDARFERIDIGMPAMACSEVEEGCGHPEAPEDIEFPVVGCALWMGVPE